MPSREEVAEIVVGGRSYRDWTSVAVTRSGQSWSSEFVFTAASPIESGKAGWSGQKLRCGDTCDIRLAGQAVIRNGKIKARQVAYNDRQHGLQISGLCRNSDIIQETVDHRRGEYKKHDLTAIANNLLKGKNVKFKIEGSPKGADKKFPKVNLSVGETIASVLDRLCRMRNLFVVDDADGNIVAFRNDGQVETVAELREGKNIKAAILTLMNEVNFDQVEALAQRPGSDKVWGKNARDNRGVADSKAGKAGRKLTIVSEEPGDAEDAKMRAQHEMSQNYAQLVTGSIVVQGWHAVGPTLWIQRIGKHVLVHSPMIFPSDSMTLAIQSVTHHQDPGGTWTEISLVDPAHYNHGSRVEAVAG